MYFWYKLLTYLFYIISPIYIFLRKIKKKEDPKRFKEKFSEIRLSRGGGFLVWIHAASVGETISVLPLLEYFEKEKKIKKILFTTVTLSAEEVLRKNIVNYKKITHQFLPFDVPKFVNKFLNHWSPNLCIFVDSEIWPNLILNIKEKKIPLLLINGRITKKSFQRWRYLNNFSKKIFQKFDLCIASSKESEDYLNALGAKNIKNFGNLKFASAKNIEIKKFKIDFLNKIKNRKIWCASSTHASEELLCGKVHGEVKKSYSNILTIIIPRHINRIKSVKNDLNNLGLKVILSSDLDQLNDKTDILLINTYGETSKFFNITKNVFIGGSIINRGGQNPIEPSKFGCNIFHGPNINNFKEVYIYLNSLDVSREVNNAEELSLLLIEEFKSSKENNVRAVEKIDIHGLNILNNVFKEIQIYINT